MNMKYNITKGQLISLWVFAIIAFYWGLMTADDYTYTSCNSVICEFFAILAIAFLPFMIFYTIGWRNRRKKKIESK